MCVCAICERVWVIDPLKNVLPVSRYKVKYGRVIVPAWCPVAEHDIIINHTPKENRGLAAKIPDHMRRTTPYGICLPPYQNTIGGRHPSIRAGPLELNLHSHVVGAR